MVGRYRPVEQDALRVLTVVHQLGERTADEPPARWFIDTESQLRHLDHLVRHPIDLAYLLIDQLRTRPGRLEPPSGDLAPRVRQLLGAPRRGRHRAMLLRPFDRGSWHRLDDALALAACRGLLRVEPLTVAEGEGAGAGELRYRLTGGAASWLRGSVYPRQPGLAPYRERCELLREVLPESLLRPRSPEGGLGACLRSTAERLEDFRSDAQLRPEDDLLGRLFQSTFREML